MWLFSESKDLVYARRLEDPWGHSKGPVSVTLLGFERLLNRLEMSSSGLGCVLSAAPTCPLPWRSLQAENHTLVLGLSHPCLPNASDSLPLVLSNKFSLFEHLNKDNIKSHTHTHKKNTVMKCQSLIQLPECGTWALETDNLRFRNFQWVFQQHGKVSRLHKTFGKLNGMVNSLHLAQYVTY